MGMEGEKAVSILGVCRHLLAAWPQAATTVGGVLTLVAAGLLGAVFLRRRNAPIGLVPLGVAGAGLVLLAPHAYYYDTGLLLFAALALLKQNTPRAPVTVLGLWLAGLAQTGAALWGLSPLFPALVTAFGLLLVPALRPPAKGFSVVVGGKETHLQEEGPS